VRKIKFQHGGFSSMDNCIIRRIKHRLTSRELRVIDWIPPKQQQSHTEKNNSRNIISAMYVATISFKMNLKNKF
ncbi:MAG: hypothetical protein ACI90V_005557, partial [Bacillariaceae sp.]|jgi:hypothetical protein